MGRENPVSDFTPEIQESTKDELSNLENEVLEEMKERAENSNSTRSVNLGDFS